ncbi:MAG: diguanylate cyclase [Terriglobales bacterium]
MAFSLATLAVCALALPVFIYVQLQKRDVSLRGWAGFWALLLTRQVLLNAAPPGSWAWRWAGVCALAAAAALLFSARHLLATIRQRVLPHRWTMAAWVLAAAGAAAVLMPPPGLHVGAVVLALLLAAVLALLWWTRNWPCRLLALAVAAWAGLVLPAFPAETAVAAAGPVLLSWAMLWLLGHRQMPDAAAAPEQLQLYRQSVRRSREFEILTHIGTALSSSLDAEALLQTIHTQLQKLMDVRCFYVAFQDHGADQIRFAFEVENGQRQPPRSRPRTQALTEHVIATGQPLLISRCLDGFLREHGLVRSGTAAKTWMGVPILGQGEACGVLAVQSNERENAFDTGHLRVLEILAAQAGVALDNARLFSEVQRDAGQKAFLNHIARLTISTLSASEMLAAVAAAIARDFGYDHVAVVLAAAAPVDTHVETLAAPEADEVPQLRVAAVAGAHAYGLVVGDLLVWGRGLAGRAAATGLGQAQPQAPELAGRGEEWRRCPQAASGLALPIRYAGQTLGVLHLETHAARGFPSDQVLVLQTLSDQLAVALNHAILFQQMQQQAITDSLTGVKSRRFFLDALQAEWRRARAARAHPGTGAAGFALVLVDLDGFKPLNDRYGHMEGDRILVRVAHLLEQRSRGSSVVARYGGDEFTILVPACDSEIARQLPQRLQTALDDDPVLAHHRLRGSFGLAVFPDSGATPEELLHFADAEMYRTKQTRQHRAAAAAPMAG